MQTIYERIRLRREELGYTQKQLAQRLGYKSRSSINKIENEANDIPQSKIQAFAVALNTSSAWLMGLSNQSPDPELEEYLDFLKNREDMRMLFSVSKNASKEDVMLAVSVIEALRNKKKEGDQ